LTRGYAISIETPTDLDTTAAPDIGSHDDGTFDVYATDTSFYDPSLQHFSHVEGTPTDPAPDRMQNSYDYDHINGQKVKPGTGPSIVGRGDQRFVVEYTGADGSVWQREYDFGFKNWTRIL